MNGLYIVQLNNVIYGVYTSSDDAKICQIHVNQEQNKCPEIKYLILNKNYWEH